jgi:hypothetical protein
MSLQYICDFLFAFTFHSRVLVSPWTLYNIKFNNEHPAFEERVPRVGRVLAVYGNTS